MSIKITSPLPYLPVLVEPATFDGRAVDSPSPQAVRLWFDASALAPIPVADGTLGTARAAATAFARSAKADNTRRAYRSGVRVWCLWCEQHALPCLPARGADVAAFLAEQRLLGRSPSTIDLRRAAIRYLHIIAGCPVPTGDASVSEAVAGIRRKAAQDGFVPSKKMAATASIVRQLLGPIDSDLRGLRDRALLLIGFVGALRRAELAAIRVEHVEARDRGIRITLPLSKGERTGRAVAVAIPFGETDLCPVRALKVWLQASGIVEGPIFRRIWVTPEAGPSGSPALPQIGQAAIEPRTVARIVQTRASAAGFGKHDLGGHSLKRGALTTGMDRGVHPTKLKRLGRHKSYAVLDDYLEAGDPFEGHPLDGIL